MYFKLFAKLLKVLAGAESAAAAAAAAAETDATQGIGTDKSKNVSKVYDLQPKIQSEIYK